VSSNPVTFQMPLSGVTITAHFTLETFTLTVTAEQGGSVAFYVSPDNTTWTQVGTVSSGQTYSWTVPVGYYVRLQAIPASGYLFSGWGGVP